MNPTLKTFKQAAKHLTTREQAALAHSLLKDLDEIEGDESYIESLWASEAEDRLDGYLDGELSGSSLSEVVGRVRARIRK